MIAATYEVGMEEARPRHLTIARIAISPPIEAGIFEQQLPVLRGHWCSFVVFRAHALSTSSGRSAVPTRISPRGAWCAIAREYDVDVNGCGRCCRSRCASRASSSSVNPLWPPYLMRDTMRIAEYARTRLRLAAARSDRAGLRDARGRGGAAVHLPPDAARRRTRSSAAAACRSSTRSRRSSGTARSSAGTRARTSPTRRRAPGSTSPSSMPRSRADPARYDAIIAREPARRSKRPATGACRRWSSRASRSSARTASICWLWRMRHSTGCTARA